MSDWTSVAFLSDLSPGTMRRTQVGDSWIVVGRTSDSQVFATDLLCPHRGGPLDEGNVQDGVVVCPWHLWEFEIDTGKCTRFPDVRARMYETRVENDQVFVRLAEQE